MNNIVSNNKNNKYFETLSFEEAWHFIIKPNLILYSQKFFKKEKFLILVPCLSIVYALKKIIIENNISLVGVYILTPKQVLKLIIDELDINIILNNIVLKEDILFLINIINNNKLNIENISMYIFNIYYTINSYRYNDNYINKILKKLNILLKKLKLKTIEEIYKEIFYISLKKNKKIWFNTIIWGFDSFYWNYFHLLLSIKNFSIKTNFCFINENTLTLESKIWKNTWTNILDDYFFLSDSNIFKNYPYYSLYNILKNNIYENVKFNNYPCFIKKLTIIEEVDAIIEQIINIFNNEKTKNIRIAIVFVNKKTTLPKEISLKLNNLNINYYNSFDINSNNIESILFNAWVTLQLKKDLDSMIDFIENLFFFKKISFNIKKLIIKLLSNNYKYILDNNIFIILEYMKLNNNSFYNENEYNIFNNFFNDWPLFKEYEFLENLLFVTDKIVYKFFDECIYQFFKEKIDKYNFLYKKKIKSQFFLNWIKKIIKNYQKKSLNILHPYANIFLISCKEASLQNWTHVIITENNDEFWKPMKPLLSNEYLNNINYKFINFKNLNFIIENNYIIINSYKNLCKNLENSFYSLIYSCSNKLILTVRKYDLSLTNTNKILSKSIFFKKIYNIYNTQFLKKENISYKKKYIIKFLYKKSYLKAFNERRNSNKKMGIYNFMLGNKIKQLKFINFNCKDLEYMFKAPELIFFKKILGVEKKIYYNNSSIMFISIGSLIHELIYSFIFNNKKIIFTYNDIKKILLLKFNIIYKIYIKNNINIPINLINYLSKIKEILYNLSQNFSNELINEYKYFKIEEPIIINNINLPFKIYGRSDLIIFTENPNYIYNNEKNCAWIIDFKTGKNKELSLKNLIKGEGIQLFLYGIGLKEKGIKNIHMSILNTQNKIKPQINLTHDLEKNIINMIYYIYKKGLLGQKGIFNNYPIATIPIKEDILKNKWKLTHNNIDF